MSPELVFWATLVSSALGFGGFGSIPFLRQYLAGAGLHPDAILLQALSIGRLSPGPNGLFLTAVGYLVAGLWGAVAATAAVFIPPLLIVPVSALRDRLEHIPRFRATIHSLSLAVIGLLAVTALSLMGQVSNSPLAVIIACAGAVLMIMRVPPLALLALAALLGYAVGG